MSSWPLLDREPIQLRTLPGHDDELWVALIELSELRPGECLVGGQMVFLHALERAVTPPRVSTDLEVDDEPEAQRLHHALLLSLVDDPISMATQLTKKDRQRLRTRSEMDDAELRAWVSLSEDSADRGRAAYRPLTA